MTTSIQWILVAAVSLVLTACQQEGGAMPTGQPTAQAPKAPIAAVTNPFISVTPSVVDSCDHPAKVTVKWDVHAAHGKTSGVSVLVGTDPTDLKLFVSGGAQGEAQTGPWTRSGAHFVLKDKDTGRILGEAVTGGPDCR